MCQVNFVVRSDWRKSNRVTDLVFQEVNALPKPRTYFLGPCIYIRLESGGMGAWDIGTGVKVISSSLAF